MAQGEGFKHITVTPPEEEDEVIFAGAEAVGAEEAESKPLQPMPSGNGDADTSGSESLQAAPSVGAHSARPASEAGAGGLAAEVAPQPAKLTEDPYRDSTLEDLQGNPMPLTQKIVIAVALVCIIGAVIYYFAFMG